MAREACLFASIPTVTMYSSGHPTYLKMDKANLEKVQKQATQMVKEVGDLLCEVAKRMHLGLFSLENDDYEEIS